MNIASMKNAPGAIPMIDQLVQPDPKTLDPQIGSGAGFRQSSPKARRRALLDKVYPRQMIESLIEPNDRLNRSP